MVQPYDGFNPGFEGIYRITRPNQSTAHRKYDNQTWFNAGYEDTLKQALAMITRHRDKKSVANWLREFTDRDNLHVEYVCDLDGNEVSPREARRIGDPEWTEGFQPEQLELF